MKIWLLSLLSLHHTACSPKRFSKTTNIPQDIHWEGVCQPLENETKEGKDSVETEKNINVVQWSTQEEAPARRRGERSSGLLKWSSKMEAEPRSSCHSPPWAWAECQHHHTLWSFFRRQRGARWAVESLREGYKYPLMLWLLYVSDRLSKVFLQTRSIICDSEIVHYSNPNVTGYLVCWGIIGLRNCYF